jgi:hypothetical protein
VTYGASLIQKRTLAPADRHPVTSLHSFAAGGRSGLSPSSLAMSFSPYRKVVPFKYIWNIAAATNAPNASTAMAFPESSFISGSWGTTKPWRQPEAGLQRAVA